MSVSSITHLAIYMASLLATIGSPLAKRSRASNMAPKPNAANNNNNKTRGRPKSKVKNDVSGSNLISNSNYTIEGLRDKKRRSISLDLDRTSTLNPDFPASPAKRPATRSTQGDTRNRSPSPARAQGSPETSDASLQTDSSHRWRGEGEVVPSLSSTASTPQDGSAQTDSPENSTPGHSLGHSDSNVISNPLLQQMFDRFDKMERQLSKLDSMEQKLSKLDVIENKTDGLARDMHQVQGSIDSLRGEVDSVKGRLNSTEERLKKEVASLQAQIKAQDAKLADLAGVVEEKVLTEVQHHFNNLTQHLELAFVKEQAASRKQNLIFTGIQENARVPDIAKIRNTCSSFLKLKNLSINAAYRMGSRSQGSNRPRPIMVHFGSMPDRNRVWRAKKGLQRGTGSNIWIQEDMPRSLKEDLRVLLKVAKHAATLDKEEYKSIKVKDFRLFFDGKGYSPAELELLPHELRPSTLCTTWTDDMVAFFGRFSPLSNHHPSPFIVNDTSFSCVEQYLAVARARLANDPDTLDRALSCSNPSDCRGILNALREDHVEEWENCRAPVLMKALRNKFQQNKHLGDYLKRTFPRHLGEASPDVVWGIGCHLEDENATTHSTWHADGNLLGKSLTTVREELIRDSDRL